MNKSIVDGIRSLALTALLMFAGPSIVYQAFKNQGHPFFLPVLIVGIFICGYAIFSGFKGLRQIAKGLFDEN